MTQQTTRIVFICVLLVALLGTFVLHGTIEPDPSENRFPGNGELASNELDSGDRVVIAGEITHFSEARATIALSGHPYTIAVPSVTTEA